jgi:hypothetical protein
MAYLRRRMRLTTLLALAALAACSGRRDERSREEAFAARSAGKAAPRPFDFGHPADALRMTADEAAARIGAFAWEGEVSWSVARGAPAQRTAEHHRLRQLATGEFAASSEIDPGLGPGSESGREVVFADGMTFARGMWAPWRERPTDRGRDARRHRDDSFRLAGAVADLLGPALAAQPAGEVTASGRQARRFVLSLSGALPTEAPPPAGGTDAGVDPDTGRRLAFLGGRIPAALSGEFLLDGQSGVPLVVRMKATFAERADPQLRAEVELAAEVTALGASVGGVRTPQGVLADERKPKGVARALEAAGLRRRSEAPADAEDAEEGEPEEAPAR